MSVKRKLAAFASVLTLAGGLGYATIPGALAGEEAAHEGGGGEHAAAAGHHDKSHVVRQTWTFGGLTGSYDKAQLRRGFQIYNEVCSSCHAMGLLSYRNLMEVGGTEFTKEEVKAFIADKEVPAGPNDEGETHGEDGSMLMRPAIITDRFVSPYANDKAAQAANGGALPPDFSVIANARGIPHASGGESAGNIFSATIGGFGEYFSWLGGVAKDVVTMHQEGGVDYIYALLMGFEEEAPKGMEVPEGKYFNWVFPGHAISMPPQINDEMVEYADGTKPTADQHARDISSFLMWASEPHLNARKRLGLKVLLYMLILSGLMYAVKRTIWSGVKH